MPAIKSRKLKLKYNQELTKQDLSHMRDALETAYYDSYGNNKQYLLRLANIIAEAGKLDPFVPNED